MNLMRALRQMILFSLLVVVGCAPQEIVVPGPELQPSRVVTSEGVRFEVLNLRLPGTQQDLKIKIAGTTIWIPLADVSNIRLSGAVMDQYRPALLFLVRGGRLEGELFVGFILEGESDQGYWNIHMTQVESVDFGSN